MDALKQKLKGSPRRDLFKQKHKDINPKFYASDADFCLISKHPPGIVAYIDFKAPNEKITFTEAILYSQWAQSSAPVYIVESTDPERGPFVIKRFLGADYRPDPPLVVFDSEVVYCKNWGEFEQWESGLRQEYKRRGGWSGNLRIDPVVCGLAVAV